MEHWTYAVATIPDLAHQRFRAIHAKDLQGHIFQRAEQLLRMAGRFAPGELVVRLRGDFDPSATDLQERLRWSLLISAGPSVTAVTVEGLVMAGPLAPFYDFKLVNPDAPAPRIAFEVGAVCEVVRREEAFAAYRGKNDLVPDVYHGIQPFIPNKENDWLLLDRALAGLRSPARLELTIGIENATPLQEDQLTWIKALKTVNAYEADAGDEFNDGLTVETAEPGATSGRAKREKDLLADEFLRESQEFFKGLRKPQYRFALRALAREKETAHALASVAAECCFRDGRYTLVPWSVGDAGFEQEKKAALTGALRRPQPTPGVLPAQFLKGRLYHPVFDGGLLGRRRELASIATAEELAPAFRLPVVSGLAPRTMRSSTDPSEPVDPKTSVLVGFDMEAGVEPDQSVQVDPARVGRLFDTPDVRVPQLRLPLSLFTKHLFVAGVPGSGKTTAVFNLLVQLHRQREAGKGELSKGIPFLVIEPAKTEYRALKALVDHPDPGISAMARDLRVFTPGNEQLSPLRFNPFEFPKQLGITRDEHIELVMASFKAGMPMWGPLEAIIADSVEAAYERLPDNREFPTMGDVVSVAREIAATKGYEGEAKSNIEAAIGVRLEGLTKRSVGKIFSDERSFPSMEDLLAKPTVIELEHLSSETACLFTLFLLSALRERIRKTPSPGGALRHVIVIEEAHNIVGHGEARQGENSVDPRPFAAQYVSRMLAEMRALGEGIVIADQLPSAVASQVVKNTGTKIAGRLVAKDDREQLGAAMLLDANQIEEIARLRPGDAFLYHEGLHRPRRVRGLNATSYLGLRADKDADGRDVEPIELRVSGDRLVTALGNDLWFQEMSARSLQECVTGLAKANVVLRVICGTGDQWLREDEQGVSCDLRAVHARVLTRRREARDAYCRCEAAFAELKPRFQGGLKPRAQYDALWQRAVGVTDDTSGLVSRTDALLEKLDRRARSPRPVGSDSAHHGAKSDKPKKGR